MKLILALFTLLSLQVFSQELHPDFHLYQEAQQDQLIFSDAATIITLENWQIADETKAQFLAALKKEAQERFDIWGDTVLGGDYSELGGDWTLRDLQVYIIDGKAAAFSGIVANKAVYYGDDYCDYDYFELHDQWNQECLEKNIGEIKEMFFLDTKSSYILPSANMYSDFYFDNGRTLY